MACGTDPIQATPIVVKKWVSILVARSLLLELVKGSIQLHDGKGAVYMCRFYAIRGLIFLDSYSSAGFRTEGIQGSSAAVAPAAFRDDASAGKRP